MSSISAPEKQYVPMSTAKNLRIALFFLLTHPLPLLPPGSYLYISEGALTNIFPVPHAIASGGLLRKPREDSEGSRL
jgi:hypothetical protein